MLVVVAADELLQGEPQDLGRPAEVPHAAQHLTVREACPGRVHVEPRHQIPVVAVGGVVGVESRGPGRRPAQIVGGARIVGTGEVRGEGVDGVRAAAQHRLGEGTVQLPATEHGELLVTGHTDQGMAEDQPRLVPPCHDDLPLLDERGVDGPLQRVGRGTVRDRRVQPVRGHVEQFGQRSLGPGHRQRLDDAPCVPVQAAQPLRHQLPHPVRRHRTGIAVGQAVGELDGEQRVAEGEFPDAVQPLVAAGAGEGSPGAPGTGEPADRSTVSRTTARQASWPRRCTSSREASPWRSSDRSPLRRGSPSGSSSSRYVSRNLGPPVCGALRAR